MRLRFFSELDSGTTFGSDDQQPAAAASSPATTAARADRPATCIPIRVPQAPLREHIPRMTGMSPH
jgi:hypothetical protein